MTPLIRRPPWHRPLNADRCEESYSYEVARHGGEGPEEVLPQVGLLQGEVLVGLQAGGHLRQGVGVTLMKGLFPKVLILQERNRVQYVKAEEKYSVVHRLFSETKMDDRKAPRPWSHIVWIAPWWPAAA